MTVTYSTRVVEARRGRGEDMVATVRMADRTVVVVADGAGGVAGGAAAACEVCIAVVEECQRGTAVDWSEWLVELDRAMASSNPPGIAATVVVEVADDGRVAGASVGDCEAWIFGNGTRISLTSEQVRKPLLGEGTARPVPFEARVARGTLLVATDGLWKYMATDRIAEMATVRPLAAAVAALVHAVRLANGALQDDIALAICEVRQESGEPLEGEL
jgi:serine/threonine protein phosphatase PrpC